MTNISGKILGLELWPKCCQPIKLQDTLKCNIVRKKWLMQFIFGMQINIEVSHKVILSFGWVEKGMLKISKISLHVFAISTQKHGDEVDFLPADKHKSFRQDNSITLDVRSQTSPKYQKQPVYNISAISQEKHKG